MSEGGPIRPWWACSGDPCTCPKAAPAVTPRPSLRGDCRGCGCPVDDYRAHVYGERKCCPDCDHRPLPGLDLA